MEFKGTKGKWELKNMDNNWLVMYNNINLVGINNNKANALLISKAPEMLEMLNKIVLMTDTCKGTFQDFKERYNLEIKQLIKEATEI